MPRSFVLVGGPALVPPRAIKPVTTSLCMAGNEELTHYSLSWWARCVQNLFAIQCPGTASVVGHSPTCCASAVPHHECIVPCGNPVIMHPMPLQHRAATPIEAWSGSGLQRPSRWVSAFAPNMPCMLTCVPPNHCSATNATWRERVQRWHEVDQETTTAAANCNAACQVGCPSRNGRRI